MLLDKLVKIRNFKQKADKGYFLDEFAKECGPKLLEMIFDKDVRFFTPTAKLELPTEEPLFIEDNLDQQLEKLLYTLSTGEVRGNENIILCQDFVDKLTRTQAEMFVDILENKTRLGIGSVDIAKYCKNFTIEQFEVMFAMRYDKVKKFNYSKRYVIQPKIDGQRCICIKGENQPCNFFSRTGESFTSLKILESQINNLLDWGSCVIDGEIEAGDTLESGGAVRRKNEQVENPIYTIFGIYKIGEWESKQHTEMYEAALDRANIIIGKGRTNLRVIPTYEIPSGLSEKDFDALIQKYTSEFIEMGYEGAVLKSLDHVYQPSSGSKRSKDWLKIKPQRDSEGTIVDIIEEDSLEGGRVGKFRVRWINNEEFDVATGKLKKETCKYIWEHKEEFLKRQLEFSFQLLSAYGVPRHAFAIKVRE